MKRLFSLLFGLALAVSPEIALAEEVGGGYEGIASIYFTFIGLILIFGAYHVMGPKPYMSYSPGGCLTTHWAARSAPRANVSRLCTR